MKINPIVTPSFHFLNDRRKILTYSIIKITTTLLVVCVFSFAASSQNIQTTYYKNESLSKQVPQEKAKFSCISIQNSDGSITSVVKNLKSDRIIRRETLKGEEPFGIWLYEGQNGVDSLNYNFEMNYTPVKCMSSDTTLKLNDFFHDCDSLKYIAPKLATGEPNLYQYIAKHIYFPARAREEGIDGKVFLSVVFTETGTIENIAVIKGKHILLDKEAVRVLREAKLLNPASYNGEKIRFCFNIPISFRIL